MILSFFSPIRQILPLVSVIIHRRLGVAFFHCLLPPCKLLLLPRDSSTLPVSWCPRGYSFTLPVSSCPGAYSSTEPRSFYRSATAASTLWGIHQAAANMKGYGTKGEQYECVCASVCESILQLPLLFFFVLPQHLHTLMWMEPAFDLLDSIDWWMREVLFSHYGVEMSEVDSRGRLHDSWNVRMQGPPTQYYSYTVQAHVFRMVLSSIMVPFLLFFQCAARCVFIVHAEVEEV